MIALKKGKGDYNTRKFGDDIGRWRSNGFKVLLKSKENIDLCYLLTLKYMGSGKKDCRGKWCPMRARFQLRPRVKKTLSEELRM